MASRKSIIHPEMEFVKLRPMQDPKDLPSIEEHLLDADYGKKMSIIGGR